jgi:hypothetical protein
MFVTLLCSLLALSDAKITWSVGESHALTSRRLELNLLNTSYIEDADCIVGGFDSRSPDKVYVGGPCNLLAVTEDSEGNLEAEALDGFRYVSMEVVHGGIQSEGGDEVDLPELPNSAFYHASETTLYGKVGTSAKFQIQGYKANVVAGQTSYVAKAKGSLKKNDFAFNNKTDNTVEEISLCVVPCCTPVGNERCYCSDTSFGACTGDATNFSSGDYKFSVFLASFDDSSATPGPGGNGWARLVEDHGEGSAPNKELKGSFFIDQVIDFTNMLADTLTITKLDDTTITYANMAEFDNNSVSTTTYRVKSMKVESDGWSAAYAFPLTYNGGVWNATTGEYNSSLIHGFSANVKIHAVKPSTRDMVSLGVADTLTEAASMKVVYLRYEFNITGIEGAENWGSWMAYDPVITSSNGLGSRSSTSTGAPGGQISQSNQVMPCFFMLVTLAFLFKN